MTFSYNPLVCSSVRPSITTKKPHHRYMDMVQGGTSCAILQAGLWGFFQFMRIFVVSKGENEASHMRWKGCPQSSIFIPQSSVLSPQSLVLRNAQKQCFCSQKLDLRHFSRECRENLNIRTLRIKFRNKSVFEDSPQLVPACWTLGIMLISI